MENIEKWKSVKGYEGCYEISSFGNLRSKDRLIKHYKGGFRKIKGVNKSSRFDKYGYLRCSLKKDGETKHITIHRLVGLAFIKNIKNKPQINHIDGVKTNNKVTNLEWVTSEQNVTHAVKNRLIKTKLTDEQVTIIMSSKLSIRKLALIYNVSSSIIWRIKNKIAYKHVTNK